jgi:hypothetical protein
MNFNIKKDVIPSLENEDIIEEELKEESNTLLILMPILFLKKNQP